MLRRVFLLFGVFLFLLMGMVGLAMGVVFLVPCLLGLWVGLVLLLGLCLLGLWVGLVLFLVLCLLGLWVGLVLFLVLCLVGMGVMFLLMGLMGLLCRGAPREDRPSCSRLTFHPATPAWRSH
jgi:hypothetical protein